MIIVDSREPIEIFHGLSRSTDVQVKREALQSGDYSFQSAFGQTILIERKTISDLFSSIINGRVASELIRCLNITDYTFLLVEGLPRINKDGSIMVGGTGSWPLSSYTSFLTSVQIAGVFLIYSRDLEYTPSVILSTYNFFQKKNHSVLLRIKRRAPDSRVAGSITALTCCSGVGVINASHLLKKYGSIANICKASAEELSTVIGNAMAVRLYNFLNNVDCQQEFSGGNGSKRANNRLPRRSKQAGKSSPGEKAKL